MAYDRETVFAEVLRRMVEGETLTHICADENMPAYSTVSLWIIEEGKSEEYARAKEQRADRIFEEILNIADDTSKPPEDRRIAIDARKWAAGKLHGKYSDKVKHVGGDDGDAAIKFTGFDIRFIE